MKIVSLDLLKKMISKGMYPYVHILADNAPSMELFTTLGFVKQEGSSVIWLGIH